jgi:hypothetical protein
MFLRDIAVKSTKHRDVYIQPQGQVMQEGD